MFFTGNSIKHALPFPSLPNLGNDYPTLKL